MTGEHLCRSAISIKLLVQLYWTRIYAWVFSCKFAAYFQKNFSSEHLFVTASKHDLWSNRNEFINHCIYGKYLYPRCNKLFVEGSYNVLKQVRSNFWNRFLDKYFPKQLLNKQSFVSVSRGWSCHLKENSFLIWQLYRR